MKKQISTKFNVFEVGKVDSLCLSLQLFPFTPDTCQEQPSGSKRHPQRCTIVVFRESAGGILEASLPGDLRTRNF